MSVSESALARLRTLSNMVPESKVNQPGPQNRKPPQRVTAEEIGDPLLTIEDVARKLNVRKDWVWDHSSRKVPRLPVIRMGDGALRYRRSSIEDFINERERLSSLRVGQR